MTLGNLGNAYAELRRFEEAIAMQVAEPSGPDHASMPGPNRWGRP